MAIQFECPSCGKQLKAPEDTAGRKGKCPHCQSAIQVPEPVYQAEEVPVAEEVAAQGGYSLAPQPEPGPEENRRPCPACGERIMATAVKCRFCGEIFDPTLRRARRKKGRSYSAEDSQLTALDWVLALFTCNIGCIVSIVYMCMGKPKGVKMFAINIVAQVVLGVLYAIVQAGAMHR